MRSLRNVSPVGRETAVLLAAGAVLALVGTPAQAAPQADLVIESVTHTPSSSTRGDIVTFTVTVRNQGDAHLHWFYVGFWSHLVMEPTASDTPEQQKHIVELPAGAAATLDFELPPPLAEGPYTAWAYADSPESVDESNEDNNAGPVGGHAWSVSTSPEPDLFVESIALAPPSPVPGEAVTFSVTVTNLGGSAAAPFSVGFWSDRATEPSIDDAPEQSQDGSGLAAGASAAVDFVVTVPSAGTYLAYAYADRRDGTGEVAETNEENNLGREWWKSVAPDAYESDDTFAEAKPISDDEVQSHSIHFAGDEDYMTFTLSDPGGVTVRLTGGLFWPDARATLYDSSQTPLAGSDLDGVLSVDALAAGTYYVMARARFSSWVLVGYTLSLVVWDADTYEVDDIIAQAKPIANGETQIHSLHSLVDRDYVVFSLSETSDVVLRTGWTAGIAGSTVLYLYDSTGTEIAFAYDFDRDGVARVAVPGLPAGTYYGMARAGSFDYAFPYTLSLTVTPSSEPDLVIESVTCDPSEAVPGQTVTFTVTVKNRGGVDAGGFNVAFWSDWPWGSMPEITDLPEQDSDAAGLAAGAWVDVTFQATAASAGNYWAYAYADRRDGTGEVAEFSELNNRGYARWLVAEPDDYEPDDSFSDATVISPGEAQTHSVHAVGDQDYVTFTLGSAATVTIWAATTSAKTIYLYDSTQTELDSSSGGLEVELAAGAYYVMVEEWGNDGLIGAYDLNLSILGPDSYEPDDSFAQASPITDGEVQTHSIHVSGDRDYMTFTLSSTADVTICTSRDVSWLYTAPNVAIYLFDASQRLLLMGEERMSRPRDSVITASELPAGTYYVMSEQPSGYPVAAYALSFSTMFPDAYELDDSFAEAKPIADGEVQTHSIHVPGDEDYVVFTLDTARDVVIETDGAMGDTLLWLYDSDQTEIAFSDNRWFSFFSHISEPDLPPGTYYAMVRARGSTPTIPEYSLRLDIMPHDDEPATPFAGGCVPGGPAAGAIPFASLALAALAALAARRGSRAGRVTPRP